MLLKKVKACNALCYEDCDVNAVDKDGRTPVMVACQLGHAELVTMLCEYDADVTLKDNNGTFCCLDALTTRDVSLPDPSSKKVHTEVHSGTYS